MFVFQAPENPGDPVAILLDDLHHEGEFDLSGHGDVLLQLRQVPHPLDDGVMNRARLAVEKAQHIVEGGPLLGVGIGVDVPLEVETAQASLLQVVDGLQEQTQVGPGQDGLHSAVSTRSPPPDRRRLEKAKVGLLFQNLHGQIGDLLGETEARGEGVRRIVEALQGVDRITPPVDLLVRVPHDDLDALLLLKNPEHGGGRVLSLIKEEDVVAEAWRIEVELLQIEIVGDLDLPLLHQGEKALGAFEDGLLVKLEEPEGFLLESGTVIALPKGDLVAVAETGRQPPHVVGDNQLPVPLPSALDLEKFRDFLAPVALATHLVSVEGNRMTVGQGVGRLNLHVIEALLEKFSFRLLLNRFVEGDVENFCRSLPALGVLDHRSCLSRAGDGVDLDVPPGGDNRRLFLRENQRALLLGNLLFLHRERPFLRSLPPEASHPGDDLLPGCLFSPSFFHRLL